MQPLTISPAMVPFKPSATATVLAASTATLALLAFIPLQSAWQHGTSALGFALPAASHQAAGPSTSDVAVHALTAAYQQQHQRKLDGTAWLLPANGLAVVAAVAALAFGATRSSSRSSRNSGFIQRRAVYNSFKRPGKTVIIPYNGELPYPAPRNFWPGQKNYKRESAPVRPLGLPNRVTLSKVHDAMLKIQKNDFLGEPPAELKFADVKEVGSCTLTHGDDGPSVSAPASFPTYVKPRIGWRMEKEEGPKKPPSEHEEYKAHVESKHTLVESASKTSLSMNKDIISDRDSLMQLLGYVDGTKYVGDVTKCVDVVKISKVPGSKTLAFEQIFNGADRFAERRPYLGRWKRSEVSNGGGYGPAWYRLATGDTKTFRYMVTGLKQIAGSAAGSPPLQYRFLEYSLGGLSFLTRTEAQATLNGSSVEFKTANFYHQDKYTVLQAYNEMLLGGVDMTALAIHRSGKVTDVLDVNMSDIQDRTDVKEAAERRFGKLVAMIKQIKEAIEKSGDDGPWVLQYQEYRGLVLGKYEMPPQEESEEEGQPELELEVA